MYVLLLSHLFLSFRMLRVGTIKSFVDVITTVGRLPHIEVKQE